MKKYQVFSIYSMQIYFYWKVEMVFFMLILKIYYKMQKCLKMTILPIFCLLENAKISKNNNFWSFSFIFGALKLFWEGLKILRELFRMVIFNLSQKMYLKTQKCLKMTLFGNFCPFGAAFKHFWEISKNLINFHRRSSSRMFLTKQNLRW